MTVTPLPDVPAPAPRTAAAAAHRGVWAGLAAAAVVAAVVGTVLLSLPDPVRRLANRPEITGLVTDRHGVPLRLVPGQGGTRFLPVDPRRVSPHLVAAVLAAEDRRFFRHPGVDAAALCRAAWQNLTTGRIVSGGSTITMQLARLLDPRPRTLVGKALQIVQAIHLELRLDKDETLAAYLSRVPMGNRLVGFEAAALAYLGKPASQLSPAEAALLAAVPRAPSRTNPWRDLSALRRARDRVLQRMYRAGFLDGTALAAASREEVILAKEPFQIQAPHFLARALAEAAAVTPDPGRVTTTLDLALQRRVEVIVRRHLARLAAHGVTHMAVVVLDVPRSEWLALEGSGGFAEAPAGQLDGTRVPRQPGSALKPFTYATAFDRGVTPATILADVPTAYPWSNGTWVPRNYDERYHGPLRARQALACSVNVPAAQVLADVGPETLLDTLRNAGITTLTHSAEHYGLGLTLGAGEVRLDELTVAFAALLRGGEWRPARSVRAVWPAMADRPLRPQRGEPRRVCSAEAAAQVVDILADPEARAPAFGEWSVLRLPFPAAVKTGTSEGFRDNWCIGGTAEVAVGVWCGNFDRTPMGNVSGVTGAGAVWREVMLAWAALAHGSDTLAGRDTLGPRPPGLVRARVCALSGQGPTPACPATVEEWLRPADADLPPCAWHVTAADGQTTVRWPARFRAWAAEAGLASKDAAPASPNGEPSLAILSPADGDAFVLSPELPAAFQRLELRCAATGITGEVAWLVDGVEVGRGPAPHTFRWPLTRGSHRIHAEAAGLRSRPVRITVY